jgi:Chaperone of endosialidase
MKLQNLIHILIGIVCIGLLPKAQAVVPPPDGGYPGFNTAEGQNALLNLMTGAANTAVGWYSLFSATTASFNTGVGGGSLALNNGDNNTATGAGALLSNITGIDNTANGAFALSSNTTGDFNTATGFQALLSTTDIQNTANGAFALFSNTTGRGNTAFGFSTLAQNTTGDYNVAIGFGAGAVTTASNVITIGSLGANVSNSCYIGNIWQQPGGSQAVYVNESGKLGAQVSSRRFKDEIKPMEDASEVIYALKPVSFRYKAEIEPTRPLGFGLIAEDVEKVNSNLVTRDKGGRSYSVRYDQVNAMLLNEFLKEHRKNEKQEAIINRLQKQIEALRAGLQKVSVQLEASRPAPQVINNP